ncbi:glycosyltransferase [Peribacillus sp. NPDC101481]|uniref:glycosyltransferase n=1 Tax=Peribacillus sp. NPDC101481 TaxID=3364403 RepID=UPI0037FE2DBE
MKILLINKYFYVKGGSETYFFGLKKMLENRGHETIDFSMSDDRNYQSNYRKYFVSNVDYEKGNKITKIKNGLKLINSNEAYKNLCKLIEDSQPDIAHVNLIYHQLTPSIFHALKKYNIPIVFTSHDYKMVCPNYKLYSGEEICTKCLNGNFVNCAINKCHKDSILFSALLSIEAYYHKFKKSYDMVDKIICPSLFMKNQLIKGGYEEEKLIHIPNFLTSDFDDKVVKKGHKENKTLLYYGRLSQEKGLDLLLDAIKEINEDYILKIIGTGSEEERLKNRVSKENIKNVRFLGFKSGDELHNEISSSKATIIPSTWHEVFGLTIIESYSAGTPVIGSNLGGIPENIKDNKTGFVFENGNVESLKNALNKILSMDKSSIEYQNMVNESLVFKEEFTMDKYYSELIKLYEQLMFKKRAC